MPFIPHTPDDVARMLEVIGAQSIDDLFDEIPSALKIDGSIRGAAGAVRNGSRAAADRARRARWPAAEFHRRRRLRAPHSRAGVGHRHARGILFRLHALPGGGEPGHAAADLRISVHDVRADRHGGVERLSVRRRLGAGRGVPHGRAREPHVDLAAHSAAARRQSDLCAGRARDRLQSGHRFRCRGFRSPSGAHGLDALAGSTAARMSTALVVQQPNFFGNLEEVGSSSPIGRTRTTCW